MGEIHERARREILEHFPPSADPLQEFHKHAEDFYVSTLHTLRYRIPFGNSSQNEALLRFLYAGCLRFDRWFTPSPYIVDPQQSERYARFVRALVAAGATADNVAVFQVHQVRDAAFAEFDGVPLEHILKDRVHFYQRQINAVAPPTHPGKLAEFEKERTVLLKLLKGLQNGSLRTVLITTVPYVFSRAPLVVSFRWKGIEGTVKLDPSFDYGSSGESTMVVEPAGISVGASRWQTGRCRIEITLAALHDADAWSESLQAPGELLLPVEGWPQCFNLGFAIIHELAWHLRVDGRGSLNWIPAPRDLGEMELCIRSGSDNLTWKLKGSPASVVEVFTPAIKTEVLDLGELGNLRWSMKSRSLSQMYLELGETNEALFWLNVATEALFKERFVEFASLAGRPDLDSELNSPKAFWGPAEEIIADQFPEVAGKVKWPSTEVHVSLYAKIRYVYRNLPMKTSVKEVLTRYRSISEHRNRLFHGVTDTRTPVTTVRAALEAFDWLAINLVVSEPSMENQAE